MLCYSFEADRVLLFLSEISTGRINKIKFSFQSNQDATEIKWEQKQFTVIVGENTEQQ